jgi:hypothetical protein
MRLNSQPSGTKTARRPFAVLKRSLKEKFMLIFSSASPTELQNYKRMDTVNKLLFDVCSINHYPGKMFRQLVVIYRSSIIIKSKKNTVSINVLNN